jgi:hypothetical protein
MRYRLRTLLILLAVLPPVPLVIWWLLRAILDLSVGTGRLALQEFALVSTAVLIPLAIVLFFVACLTPAGSRWKVGWSPFELAALVTSIFAAASLVILGLVPR